MNNTESDPVTSNETIRRADYAREKGEIVMRKHEYDGIQEYDQKLPNWWLFTLWASISAFLIYYTLYYTFDLLPSSQVAMDERVEQIENTRKKALEETLAKLDDKTLVNVWSTDEAILNTGKEIYGQHCAACHAPDYGSYGGVAARALNDGEWFYGGKPMDVFKIINEGTPAGSNGLNGAKMEAWGKTKLSAEQVAQVTAFLISINPDDFKKYK